MGILHLSDLDMASWGATWQPDGLAREAWLNVEPHPPDDDLSAPPDAWDGRPIFKRLDAFGEDALRLRRLIVGR